MKKVLLIYGIPVIIILAIGVFLAIKRFTLTTEPGTTIIEANINMLFEYWYLGLILIITYIWIQFIAPKILKD
jgi:hypothetical protein